VQKSDDTFIKNIPDGVLLIGDSMIRNIDPETLEAPVFLFSYPGIKARQLCNQIKVFYQLLFILGIFENVLE